MSDKLKRHTRLISIVSHNIIEQYYSLLCNRFPNEVGKFLCYVGINRMPGLVERFMTLYNLGLLGTFVDAMYNINLPEYPYERFSKNLRERIFKELNEDELFKLAKLDARFGGEMMYHAVLKRDMSGIERYYDIGIALPKITLKELNMMDNCDLDADDWYDAPNSKWVGYQAALCSSNSNMWDIDNNGRWMDKQASLCVSRKFNPEAGTYSDNKLLSIFNQTRIDFMEFLMRHDMIIYDTNTYSAQTDYYNTRNATYSTLPSEDNMEFMTYALEDICRPCNNDAGFGDDTDTIRYFAPDDFAAENVVGPWKS
ncbi:hypothetical protein PRJ_Dakar_00169 [Faustovirus]|nr:hypothetical protein PRJ_Dakar_00169 [Faustovirus]